MAIEKVTVIGSGIMGHGIAQVVATAGLAVCLNDISADLLEKARTKIATSLDGGIKRGKISTEDKEAILGRITLQADLAQAAAGADLVIEAAPENLDIKQTLFRRLAEVCGPETILASNTSQYSITEIASVVTNPARVIGMHWFNPPVAMKLIEIVKGLETSEEVLRQIVEFAAGVGKQTVVCKDSQGFISTRVLMAMRLECYRLMEEGVATPEDIDKTLRLAFGHPMGQFELADFSGIDIEIPACEALTRVFGDRFRATQGLIHRVKAGKLGRKSGEGWYKYEQ